MSKVQSIQTDAVTTDSIPDPLLLEKNIHLSVLRLDKVHPAVSGNKWFKLKHYLTNAQSKDYRTIATFGGAYSNHIAATAFAAKLYGFQSVGFIRGEEPKLWSHTLLEAQANGMNLYFLPRQDYDAFKREPETSSFLQKSEACYLIPEGGIGAPGLQGASEILDLVDISVYSHIISAVGTGTTMAGLLTKTTDREQVLGFPAMKNNNSLLPEIELLLNRSLPGRFNLVTEYHFGGYAKYTSALIDWMNQFYEAHHIPLDFVYTGKMMYGIFDLAKQGFFPAGSTILAIHTGGLQGNRSLAEGMLKY